MLSFALASINLARHLKTSASTYHKSANYRYDIEGLRALAVILVILAHSHVPGLSGGFIGVDIFFVISGYLITGLLVKETAQSERIDFLSFYARRLKRLAPALYVMLAVCTLITYLLISPIDQTRHLTAAGNAAMWLSNVHFALENVDYFSANNAENLFLHTWSLSVEEQFYIIWPALTYLLWKTGTRFCATHVTRVIVTGMLSVCVLSFATSIYWTYENASYAYFMPFSRAWQFAAGGVALLISSPTASDSGTPKAIGNWSYLPSGGMSGFSGFALVAFSVLFYNYDTPYPGLWSTLPTLGTVLILLAGLKTNAASTLLSSRPFVFIGQLSYGWYLWHWPLLIFARLLDSAESAESRFIAIALSLLAAWLSKVWIENPIRYSAKLNSNPRLVLLASLAIMAVVAVSPLLIAENNFEKIITSNHMERLYRARSDMPVIYHDGCDDWTESAELKHCDYGNHESKNEVFLIGDSVSGQWFPALAELATEQDSRLSVFTKSACPMVDASYFYSKIGQYYEACDVWRSRVLAEIVKRHPAIVVMSSASTYPFSPATWIDGTRSVLDTFASRVGTVVILLPTPVLETDLTTCIANQIWQKHTLSVELNSKCIEHSSDDRGANISLGLIKLTEEYDNVYALSLNELVCPDSICSGIADDIVVFRDRMHLTNAFVASNAGRVYASIMHTIGHDPESEDTELVPVTNQFYTDQATDAETPQQGNNLNEYSKEQVRQ
jgi:peptidoglycan/LPS O-acetylase OafA/YrhL